MLGAEGLFAKGLTPFRFLFLVLSMVIFLVFANLPSALLLPFRPFLDSLSFLLSNHIFLFIVGSSFVPVSLLPLSHNAFSFDLGCLLYLTADYFFFLFLLVHFLPLTRMNGGLSFVSLSSFLVVSDVQRVLWMLLLSIRLSSS